MYLYTIWDSMSQDQPWISINYNIKVVKITRKMKESIGISTKTTEGRNLLKPFSELHGHFDPAHLDSWHLPNGESQFKAVGTVFGFLLNIAKQSTSHEFSWVFEFTRSCHCKQDDCFPDMWQTLPWPLLVYVAVGQLRASSWSLQRFPRFRDFMWVKRWGNVDTQNCSEKITLFFSVLSRMLWSIMDSGQHPSFNFQPVMFFASSH